MIVVAVLIIGMVIIGMGSRGMGIAMGVVMMLDDIPARIACVRPEYRDQPGEQRADQRQKNDCLDHCRASLRMIFSENRVPLFRIMR